MITMKPQQGDVRRRRGRPLSFNREEALERAMLLFWQHGYESTSVGDLTAVMGITAPSLYAAFGDKKGLFLDAVRKYTSGPVTAQQIIDDAATAREAAESLMMAAAVGFTGKNTPSGCLLASAAISCSDAARDVQLALSAIRGEIESRLRTKIQNDVAIGRLPKGTAAAPLAALSLAVIQGMSTLARDGAKRPKLIKIVEAAMEAWPSHQKIRRDHSSSGSAAVVQTKPSPI